MGINAEQRIVVTRPPSEQLPFETARLAPPRTVVIVGAGPAGLIAAEVLASAGHHVTIYDRMPSPARKFLLAGRGGLNLTHSEPLDLFLARYGANAGLITAAVKAFPPAALIGWAEGLGQGTFVGTSGRVFPKCMKASPLLRAWLKRLQDLGVVFKLRHTWTGFAGATALTLTGPSGEPLTVSPDAVILALGGASWPRLGSDGGWTGILKGAGAGISPLEPSNCGVRIAWSRVFADTFNGCVLKRCALTVSGETQRGDAIITRHGLEGGVVYALSRPLRQELEGGDCDLFVDLRPDDSVAALAARLDKPRGKMSMANFLRKAAALAPPAIGLVREAFGKVESVPELLAVQIKAVPLRVTGLAGLERAISTVGGVCLTSLDGNLMLTARPGVFAAGEMLDWDAPTGGYLLQASLATGVAAARGVLRFTFPEDAQKDATMAAQHKPSPQTP